MGKFFGKLEGFYIGCDICEFVEMTFEEKAKWVKEYCPWCWYMKKKTCMCFPLSWRELQEVGDIPQIVLDYFPEAPVEKFDDLRVVGGIDEGEPEEVLKSIPDGSWCELCYKHTKCVEHHISYKEEEIMYVCPSCHSKIHHSSNPEFTRWKSRDTRPVNYTQNEKVWEIVLNNNGEQRTVKLTKAGLKKLIKPLRADEIDDKIVVLRYVGEKV